MDKVFKSQKRLKKYNANRFAACLLAVLMLFSALLTGSMTVHAEATDENVVKMPVYKNETEYEEANITMQQSPIEIGDNSFELIFRPYFGTSEMNALLAANGDATRVSIGIRLTWTDAEGNLQSKDLTYTEDMVKTVYDEIKAFRVIATGINSFENLTVTPLVKSQVFTNIECLGESEQVTDATVAAESVTLDKSSLELVVDNTATLTATVAPNNATDKTVTWTSSDDTVATVENGVVTGVKAGTATITATTSNGKTATCTVTVKSEYDALMKAYENASTMKYSTDFGECTGGETVPAKTLEEGEFYFCANNGTKSGTAQYGGKVTYENGYILMSDAWGQRIEVGPTSTLESDKKFCIVECKLRYNTPGINVNLMLRGVYNNKGKEYSLGTVENGIFTDATTGVTKTLLANEWYKFTYVLDINNKKYDLYIDEVKVTEESQGYSYFRGFQGDDFFRIKAVSLTAGTTGADFMIDDIKVYGCTTDPTAKTTE